MSTTRKLLLAISGKAYQTENMNQEGFQKLLQREVEKAGNQKKASALLGVSEQFLSDVLRGRRGPGEKLLSKLGLVLRVSYVKAK